MVMLPENPPRALFHRTMNHDVQRRLPVGAELQRAGGGGVHFRVWAPKRSRVEVVTEAGTTALIKEPSGHFGGLDKQGGAGARYKFRLDGDEQFPDPASRFQPDGPHGASMVVDPHAFRWTDAAWPGLQSDGQILYEMHVGTFTAQGTWNAAADRLPDLVDLGVTAVEVMPIAEFPGRFGWGYDGVLLFAPFHHYGSCDDFRRFVDRAHAESLGVILDVVYNHVGPDGNYLGQYSDAYLDKRRTTDWGDAVNFDGPQCVGVRELVISNARHWVAEYHLDGLRLDATQNIYDDSTPHIITEIGTAARAASGQRSILLIAESEHQDARIVRPENAGGFGLDKIWCDDFHHAALVAATGRREAYYTDYLGSPQELVSAIKHGALYQGQRYTWQKHRRGSPAWDLDRHHSLIYVENHDQVANSFDGRRLHQATSPGRYRTLTALLLLAPQTPMLFQGEEFGSSAPFLFFADHHDELAALVKQGRSKFLSQFASLRSETMRARLADPADPRTFERSRLDHSERARHPDHYALHRDLIALRRCDPVLSCGAFDVDGAVLGDSAFVIRFFNTAGRGAAGQRPPDGDRLLVVNLGADLALEVAPEPLLAPDDLESGWRRLWYSDDPCYGGRGAWQIESRIGEWHIPAESATFLASA
jgi:maltooligosyltrehalose trehalohydrolase